MQELLKMDVNSGFKGTREESCNESDENSIDIYSDLDGNCGLNQNFSEDAPTNVKETFSVVQNLIQSFNEDMLTDLQNEKNVKDTYAILNSAKPQSVLEDSSVKEQTVCAEMDLFSELLTTEVKEKQEKAEKAKTEYKNLLIENAELKKSNADMRLENVDLRKQNAILKKNICALFKTAKEEMARKDALIADLRDQFDGIIFRRSRLLAAANKVPNKPDERVSSYSKQNGSVERLKPRRYSDPSDSRKERKKGKSQHPCDYITDLSPSNEQWSKHDEHHRIRTAEECLDHPQSIKHKDEHKKIPKRKRSKKFNEESKLLADDSTCVNIDQERKRRELIKGKEQLVEDMLAKPHNSSLNKLCKYQTLDDRRDGKEVFRDSVRRGNIDSDCEKMSLSESDFNVRKHKYENHSLVSTSHKHRRKPKSTPKRSSKHKKRKKSKDILAGDELRQIYTDYHKNLANKHKEDIGTLNSDEDKTKELEKAISNSSEEEKSIKMKAITATNPSIRNLVSEKEYEKDCIPEYEKKNTEVIKILRKAFDKERERLYSDYHPVEFYPNSEIPDNSTYGEEYNIPSNCYTSNTGYNFENDYIWYNDCERISSEEDYDNSYETYVIEKDQDEKYCSKKNKKLKVQNKNMHLKKTYNKHLKENTKDSFEKSQEPENKINKNSIKNIGKKNNSFKSDSKSITAAGEVPELLKEDTLKLFGYLGKAVPLVIQKKVMGCVANPQKKF